MELKKKKILDQDHDEYSTTQEFNKLATESFVARLKVAKLATKADIADFIKNTYFDDKLKKLNKKVTLNEIKHVLVQNELNKLSEKVTLI